jgi:phosphotriesterase-related protein
MPQIETTAGPVDVDALGLTLVHEHLRIRSEEVVAQFPHIYDEEREFQRAVDQVNAAKALGVTTICEPTVMGNGRDARFAQRVGEETGVQLVLSTGIYTYHYLPPHFQNRDEDYMAELFVRDIEVGIQGTDVKAGFLKCCTDEQGVTPDVVKVLRAVARASKQTGRPIMTHSHPASGSGLAQMGIFMEEGVDPAKVMIGHTGDTDSIHYIETLLAMGPFIGMDRFGLDIILPTERRNATLLELVRRGYADRMFLSQDTCCTLDWYPEELVAEMAPNWHMSFVLGEVVPALLEQGLEQAAVDQMMLENPKRWLA